MKGTGLILTEIRAESKRIKGLAPRYGVAAREMP